MCARGELSVNETYHALPQLVPLDVLLFFPAIAAAVWTSGSFFFLYSFDDTTSFTESKTGRVMWHVAVSPYFRAQGGTCLHIQCVSVRERRAGKNFGMCGPTRCT